MSKCFGELLFIILLLSGSIIGLTSQFVKADSTGVMETPIFPILSYSVLPMSFNFSTILIDGGTNVRIVFNASGSILFYCQDSYKFDMSNSTKWTSITSEWSNETSFLDINYTIPFTDRWYFTFVNNDTGVPVDIYSIAVYRVDTYEIRVRSDSQSYDMGAEALFTVTVTNDTGLKFDAPPNVSLQVFGPNSDVISNQNNLTDDYGNIAFDVLLPSEQGVFSCVAKTTIAGSNPIEDSETFAAVSNSNLPSTFDNYDHLWRTSNFTITLSAFDGNSNVTETYYRINYGPVQNVSANGQPQITMESANNTLEYWSIDQAGNEEVPKWLIGIELDRTPPTGSVMINGNLTYVNSRSILLALSANDVVSGVSQMRFSNDNSAWSDWEAYNSSANWIILPGDGLKTVYVQFVDNAGLVSGTYSVNVTLDKTDPIIENMSQIPESMVQPLQAVTILANVTDSGSGVRNVTLSYSIGNTSAWFDSQMSLNTTTGLYECSIQGQQANAQVKYMIIAYDNAGNEFGNQQGQYYVYTVVPEQFSLGLSLLLILSTLSMVMLRKKYATAERVQN